MPINLNQAPYYDDFLEDNNYLKILFRPGRAVQARELTQAQTILQNQISKIGSHLFRDGAKILGGEIDYVGVNSNIKSIQVKDLDVHGNSGFIQQLRPGMQVRRMNDHHLHPQVIASIKDVIPKANSQGNDTLVIRYLRGENIGIQANETIVIYNPDVGNSPQFTLTTILVSDGSHQSQTSHITVADGLYYYKGKFLRATSDSMTLEAYNNGATISYKIGYKVEEKIVTSSQDSSLLDPVNSASNYGAPGADRLQTQLHLMKIPISAPDSPEGPGFDLSPSTQVIDNFFQIAKVVNGRLVWTSENTVYNKLADMIAKRTYEESGNYVVKPYNLVFSQKSRVGPRFLGKLSGGVSYVKGYRHEIVGTRIVDIEKGRDVLDDTQNLNNNYGDNFIYVYDSENPVRSQEKANGLFSVGAGDATVTPRGEAVSIHSVPFHQLPQAGLSATAWDSTLVGTARPIMFVYDGEATSRTNAAGKSGSVYRLYLSDFKSNSVSGSTSKTNILDCISASSSGTVMTYTFIEDSNHGILVGDRISVVSPGNTDFQATDVEVSARSSSTIGIPFTSIEAGASLTDSEITLYHTSGNTLATQTATLDPTKSSPMNSSYSGASITFNPGTSNKETRKIVGSVGSNPTFAQVYHPEGSKEREVFASPPTWSLADKTLPEATVLLDRPLSTPVTSNTPYQINFTMKNARSVVRNQNINGLGYDKFPAELDQAWNVDWTNGIDTDSSEVNYGTTSNQLRIDGNCRFNTNGEDETLLFPLPRAKTKRVASAGNLSDGFTGTSTVYYVQHSQASGLGATTNYQFSIPSKSTFFGGDTKVWPYTQTDGTSLQELTSNSTEIKNNFILVNKTTGNVITSHITSVKATDVGGSATVVQTTLPFNAGSDAYELLVPMKATNVRSAYKELVTANTTGSATGATDLTKGQLFVPSADLAVRQNLTVPDGFKLRKVIKDFDPTSSGSIDTGFATAAQDITSSYIFDNGQRDTFYDNAYIRLKDDSATVATGNLFVMFDYFKRVTTAKSAGGGSRTEALTTDPGFFSVDSYQHTTDLIFSDVSVTDFGVGDYITSNTGASGYITEFSNSAGVSAKASVVSTNGSFLAGETVETKSVSATKFGVIGSVITADLTYEQIPVYTSSSGQKLDLKNMIDCRPYANSSGRYSETLSDSTLGLIPTAGDLSLGKTSAVSEIKSNHVVKTYAPRIDKLVVDKNGDYYTVKGTPSLDNPLPPLASRFRGEDELTLFNIHVPAYTHDLNNVVQNRNTTVRHTMKDISKLQKRIENLEYYTSLTALEKATSDMLILDSDGNSRFKNGILVDNFSGFQVVDVNNSDVHDVGSQGNANGYTMRIGSGFLQPAYQDLQEFDGPKWNYRNSNNLRWYGVNAAEPTIAMLDFEEVVYDMQASATQPMSVNYFDAQSYVGSLKIHPKTDHWFDTNEVSYTQNEDGTFDNLAVPSDLVGAGFSAVASFSDFYVDVTGQRDVGSIDGSYTQYIPWGINAAHAAGAGHNNNTLGQAGNDTLNTGNRADGNFETSRSIFLRQISSGEMLSSEALAAIEAAIDEARLNHGSFITSIIPYIREQDIVINGSGLKPLHRADVRFDETPVERYFMPASKIYFRDQSGAFSPELGTGYETIQLSAPSAKTANALLLAVRDDHFSEDGLKVGYIVPLIDKNTGLIDFTSYVDGYYGSGWTTGNIQTDGFQGTAGSRTVTGIATGASATLVTEITKVLAGTTTTHGHYNGHFSGVALGGSATTIQFSADAHRYVSNNFGYTSSPDVKPYTDIPKGTKIYIVDGPGQGQEAVVQSYDPASRTATFWNFMGAGALQTPVGAGSVYTICMSPSNILRNPEVSQYGTASTPTNKYGEKYGILHIPNNSDARFTYGRKLIELSDRNDGSNWLVSSYAATHFEAQGHRTTVLDNSDYITALEELVSPGSAFRTESPPLLAEEPYVPTYSALGAQTGKLAIAHDAYVANGGVTSDTAYVGGPAVFGSVGWTGDLTGGNQ